MKRLLEQFADQSVDGLPPADVDADVARGRRALRRIKARRRTTGVLCIAAATTAVLVAGNQAKWWDGGEAEVATDQAPPPATSAPQPGEAKPAQTPATMSMYSDQVLRLTANRQAWSGVSCTLTPQGWTAEPTGDRVVLNPPSVRTSDTDTAAQVELSRSDQPQSLSGIRVTEQDGKVFHVGSSGGREIGQVKLGERWLVAKLPVEHQDWTDDLVRRFLDSCTLS
ncbi:hypothetical protein [Kribbella amoyensis]|uniref:hypothetical protein n=1 Tax=Kribbella amoyensis TaxID=996641 RepID=UPI0011A88A02|nr:hypothetical protein [Kribbella amoyensis]